MKQLLKSPYLVMPVLTCLIVAGWVVFTANSKRIAYDIVDDKINLLQNPGFDKWEENKVSNWNYEKNGQLNYKTSRVKGFVKGHGLKLEVPEYKNGSISIVSDTVDVTPSTIYNYKMFYFTDTSLSLSVREIDDGGNVITRLLKQYPDYSYPWSTMGANFTTKPETKKIQIVITLSTKGFVELDSGYITNGATQQTSPNKSQDLLANTSWTFTHSEIVNATGVNSNGQRTTQQTNQVAGQAGWIPRMISVEPHQSYDYSFVYASDAEVVVGVDYLLENGSYRYERLAKLYPVNSPTEYSVNIEIPADAKSMQPSLQLNSIGKLTSSDESMRLVKDAQKFEESTVSITFDDGLYSSYSNGAKLLEDNDMQGTFYINPGLLGKKRYMTESDIKSLMSKGHQIGSHTHTHIDLTSFHPDILRRELDQSSQFLNKLGINQIDFASPYGKYDDILLPIVTERQRSHRSTEEGINTKQNFNPYKLYGFFVRKSTTEQELRDQLTKAKTKSGWIILIYHDIEVNTSDFSIDKGTFEKHLKIIRESGIKVKPVDQTLQKLNNS